MFITDTDGVILRVNFAFTDITGYTSEEAIGKNPPSLSSGRHDAAFYAAMWESIQWHRQLERRSLESAQEWRNLS